MRFQCGRKGQRATQFYFFENVDLVNSGVKVRSVAGVHTTSMALGFCKRQGLG